MNAAHIFTTGDNNNTTYAATTTSGSTGVQIMGTGSMLLVQNVSSVEAFVNVGDDTVTAVAGGSTNSDDNSFSVPGNAYRVLSIPDTSTYFVAITAASTTTLRVSRGTFG